MNGNANYNELLENCVDNFFFSRGLSDHTKTNKFKIKNENKNANDCQYLVKT